MSSAAYALALPPLSVGPRGRAARVWAFVGSYSGVRPFFYHDVSYCTVHLVGINMGQVQMTALPPELPRPGARCNTKTRRGNDATRHPEEARRYATSRGGTPWRTIQNTAPRQVAPPRAPPSSLPALLLSPMPPSPPKPASTTPCTARRRQRRRQRSLSPSLAATFLLRNSISFPAGTRPNTSWLGLASG